MSSVIATTTPVLMELGDPKRPALCWRLASPCRAISTAAVGGGLGVRHWVLNAHVPRDYARTDLDAHVSALAVEAECRGVGIGMLTAARVQDYAMAIDGDVVAFATVGIETPTWAAAPNDDPDPPMVGTVNIVAFAPTALADAALVNAVATATEAKVQAFVELGVAGTGTATDAVCILAPLADGDGQPFAGPRSPIGAALARAAHRAVADGVRRWRARWEPS